MSLAKAIKEMHTNSQRWGGLLACAAAAALNPGSYEMNGWCTVRLACHVAGRKPGNCSGLCCVCLCACVHACVRPCARSGCQVRIRLNCVGTGWGSHFFFTYYAREVFPTSLRDDLRKCWTMWCRMGNRYLDTSLLDRQLVRQLDKQLVR